MKKTITKLMAALALLLFVAPPLVGWGQTTETLNIGTYASAHNWNNSTAYYNACTDNVTFTGSGTGNNCKYYTSDNSWRYYSSGNGQITIACPNNNYITNITLSGTSFFTTAPDGWNYANNVFTPQEETQVNSVTIANGVGTSKITSIAVTYISSTPATVAVPTFNPVAGTYTEAQSVIISCETDGAAIYYTLDGTTPDNNSANYTDAININETTTIKAIAYIGEDASSVATAIYTIVSFEHQGTEADPYSVADAHTAIDANIGTTGVYATGIVSEIVTEYSTQYSNVTFDIVDEEGDEVFLRAYRCGGEEAPNVAVGDIAVVYGNLTKYGSTYEFAQGCEVVSLEHPTVIDPYISLSDSGTLNIGNYPVGGEITRTFTVQQSNLTEGITLTATNGGSLNPESIEQGAEATEVTWTFIPTEAGQFSSTITATSGQTTAQFTYMGYAKTVHNVMIDQNIVNGEVSAEPTTGIEGDYITLYVTPAEGYELEALTIVDANSAPINYTDFETYYRFQMPDSDVNVNATFVQAVETHWVQSSIEDLTANDVFVIVSTKDTDSYAMSNDKGASAAPEAVEVTIANNQITSAVASKIQWTGITGNNTDGYIIYSNADNIKYLYCINHNNGVRVGSGSDSTFIIKDNYIYNNTRGRYLGVYNNAEWRCYTSINTNISSQTFAFYKKTTEALPPSISAEDYEITFDTDADELEYTINNPVEGGVLTVATTSDWLMVDEDPIQIAIAQNSGSIEFLCDINSTPNARTAMVTFTYAYGDNQSTTKVITVTQEANPEAFHHISDIAEVGHTYHVKGQVMATSSRGFVIGDSTAYVYTYMGNTTFDYAVGDEVAILGTTGSYGHVIQFTSQATIETTTDVEYNGQPYPEVITAVPDYSEGYHLSTYFEFEGVLVKPTSNYYVRLSATDSICISYPTETQQTAYNNMLNKNVHVYGFFAGISSSTGFTVIVESLAEAVHYAINVTPDLIELESSEAANGALEVTYQNFDASQISDAFPIFYTPDGNGGYIPFGEEEDGPDWISFTYAAQFDTIYYTVQANDTDEARTAYFQYTVNPTFNPGAYIYSDMITINQPSYAASTSDWVLANLSDLTENDVFVIVGNNGSNYAMPNNNGTGSAPAAIKVTVENEALTGNVPDSIQWNIGITDDGYVFYPNGQTEAWLYCTDANKGVCVGTNDAKVFSLDEETGYLKHNGTGRYIGIYNSQDWRCYTTINSNIAGQTFAFYKKIVPTETYTLNVNGYGESETNGYVLLASPVYVKTETTGMTTGEFDLYYFDQSEVGYEWRNFEVEEGQFNLIPGKGYLYANSTDVELTFTGTPYSGDGSVSLVKDDNAVWSGWNLVGNPFGTTAYLDRDFYAMNEDGTEIMTDASQGAVAAMQGIFVIAENNGETLTFTTETPAQEEANVTLNLSQNRGAVIDRTIVRFGEGRQLPKFQLNTESTKLYIPQSNNDYAVVRSAAQGEMPVNFKASKNGSYTLAIDAENVEMNYLHLIDNMTGADIDLLATPSYTFDAKTTDYASRFKLVFSANANENDDENETFAFFDGSVWCISNTGEATLQVVDMLGRIVSSESVNGNATLSTDNLMSGVYMFRLVNGENVKVQKVVVK